MTGTAFGSAQGWRQYFFYFPPVRLPAPLS